ncbi:HAD-IIA family hydrolase [Thermocrinis minervae]|uniref:4-nitrophenyl phosphatase n=1 Tax=Thermocrinis minervae TaxID=381751 RepID=A0A1M6SUM7_9AQUI|nr:HAD-IIA family hydrolase [Thermocrinis minervae]SHK48376.1 4-nitrophenyl phosphatase [Thermocrinis minervae]
MRVFLLVDLDGVLVKDKKLNPFEDAPDFLNFLRKKGLPFRILSNNSTRSPRALVDELKNKGLDISYEEFLSPIAVLPEHLRKLGAKRIFLMGSKQVRDYLSEVGFEVLDDYKVDAVVIAQDREIDFRKIKMATSAIFLSGAKLVPVNQSRIVKDDDGLYFPGSGSVAQMLAHACNYKEAIPNLGKPSKEFIDLALGGTKPEEVWLISDDVYTDLMGAKSLGLKTVFLTTGKYSRDELEKANFTPDYTFDSLTDLMKVLDQLF